MRATTAPHGLRHLEDPALQSVLEAARRAAPGTGMSPGTIAGVLPSVLAYRIGLLARLIGLTYLAWPIGLAYAVVTVKSQDEMQRAIWRVAGGGGGVPPKEVGYQLDLATSAAPSKELRVFGLGQWVGDRYQSGMRAHIASVWERRRDFTPSLIVTLGLAAVVHIVALLVMGRSALRGELGIGELAFAMSSVMALIPFFNQDDMPLAFATTTLETIEEAERIVADRTLRIGGTRRAERLPARSIRFEEVRFAYPGGAEVLAGVDLELRSDERTALVGLNGAGKTTLVKLLCGMYEPTAGRITIDDGIPLTELDPVAWRRQLAVLFQDFSRFELAARDNIRYGAIHWDGDVDGAVERAAAAAGISGVLGSLPAAFDSPLAPGYEHGVDLSGGQWQRVALARALFAVDAGAQVLVLDEPTANLDFGNQVRVLQKISALAGSGIAILFSSHDPDHAFLCARRALLLAEGRVLEIGAPREVIRPDTLERMYGVTVQVLPLPGGMHTCLPGMRA
jgi:ABC-type multidrug transport system fused ATPase/permease subunit